MLQRAKNKHFPLIFSLFFPKQGIDFQASSMLGERSATEPLPTPSFFFVNLLFHNVDTNQLQKLKALGTILKGQIVFLKIIPTMFPSFFKSKI